MNFMRNTCSILYEFGNAMERQKHGLVDDEWITTYERHMEDLFSKPYVKEF
jgi:hypothetical protein